MLNLLVGLGLGCALAPLYKLYRKSKGSAVAPLRESQGVYVDSRRPFIQIAPRLTIVTKIDVPVRSRNGRPEIAKSQIDQFESRPAHKEKPSRSERKAIDEAKDASNEFDSSSNGSRQPVKLSASLPVRDINHSHAESSI